MPSRYDESPADAVGAASDRAKGVHMISWNDVLKEMQETKTPDGNPDLDSVRRSKVRAVAAHTGRPLIVYASDFLGKARGNPASGIGFDDKDGFREVAGTLIGKNVDVLLHSPGGVAEAAESVVKLLRSHFKNVRFIIPDIAKSAATMLALSGNEILLDTGAELGPIDPQFEIHRADGSVVVAPGQAIIDQFDAMEKKIKDDPRSLPVHIPILQFYAPSLYQQAKNAIDLSKRLVTEWLCAYMLASHKPVKRRHLARGVAQYLCDHNRFKSHVKGIRLEDFRSVSKLKALKVVDLAEAPELHSRVRALHYAIGLTFSFSPTAFKLFENSEGRAMVRHLRMVQVQVPPGVQQPTAVEREPGEAVKPA